MNHSSAPWLIPPLPTLLGSIPFGVLIVKALGGPDIRDIGSGNIGAANVTRNVGKFAGILTLLLDAGKGYAAVWLAGYFTHGNIRWMMIAAVFAVDRSHVSRMARFQRRQRSRHRPRRFPADLLASGRRRHRSVAAGSNFLALLVARLDLRCCRAPHLRLPALRAWPRASGNRHSSAQF